MARTNVLAGLASAGVAEIVTRAAQLLTVSIGARFLGAEGLGIFGIAWGLYVIAQTFVQSAPELIGVRMVAAGRDPLAEAKAWGRATTMIKCGFAAPAAGAMILAASLLYPGDAGIGAQTLAQALVLIAGALNVTWVFRGLGRMAENGALRCFQAILMVGLSIAGLAWRATPIMLPMAEAMATVVAAGLAWLMLRRRLADVAVDDTPRPSARPVVREALILGVAALCNSVIWTGVIPIAGVYMEAGALGYLTAALRLTIALNAVAQPVLHVFHQMLSRRYATDPAGAARLAGSLLLYCLILTMASTTILEALADPLVWIFLGPTQAAAVPFLRWLLLSLVPAVTGGVIGYAVLAAGLVYPFTLVSIAAAGGGVLGIALGYRLLGSAATLLIPVVLTGQTLALLSIAAGHDLISREGFGWRNLAARRIHEFLRER